MTLRNGIAFALCLLPLLLNAEGLRGTGDLGVIIERADGAVQLVNTTRERAYAQVNELGDLSHASVVFSRDQRYAYVFGRDGGLTKVDLLRARIAQRVIQGGNSIGGAISQDGRLIAVSYPTMSPAASRFFAVTRWNWWPILPPRRSAIAMPK